MPHPSAYAYRVSSDIDYLKTVMKIYCFRIQDVRKENDAVSKRLFSKKNSPGTLAKIKLLGSMEEIEQRCRASFQLAHCLWKLESTMVETYWAMTKWQRATNLIELLIEKNLEDDDCPCGSNENDKLKQLLGCSCSRSNDNDELMILLEKEEMECQEQYEQCGFDQAVVSVEIARYLENDTSKQGSLEQNCDDFMVDLVKRDYRRCAGCIFFFNKKDAELFGRFHDSSKSSDVAGSPSDSGANCVESCALEERDPDFSSFYCMDCYEKLVSQKEEQQTVSTVTITEKIIASSSSADIIAEEQTPLTPKSSNLSGSSIKGGKTHTSKKRRRKRKKKKVVSESPPLASPSVTDSPTPALEVLKRAALLVEKRDEFASTKESNRDVEGVSIRESCPVAMPTSTPASPRATATRFLDGIDLADDSIEAASDESARNDPNELWVEYLWKTGSMIALDRYMDEVEDTHGDDYYK
jgi:hypothetical protein